MSFLLQKSVFRNRKQDEVSKVLTHIENESHTKIWDTQCSIFKGTVLAGVYLDELVKECKGKFIQTLPSFAMPQSQPIDWDLFSNLVTEVCSLNTSSSSFVPVLLKEFKSEFNRVTLSGKKRLREHRLKAMVCKKTDTPIEHHTSKRIVKATQKLRE